MKTVVSIDVMTHFLLSFLVKQFIIKVYVVHMSLCSLFLSWLPMLVERLELETQNQLIKTISTIRWGFCAFIVPLNAD